VTAICHLKSVLCHQAQRGGPAVASATGSATKGP